MNSSINVTASINETTSTGKEEAVQIISLVLHCVIFVLGVLGNGLVIYVTGFKMKSTVNSVCFLNLALADFLFTLFLIFNIISLSLNHAWPFGDFMCKFISLVQTINSFASVFLLTAISLDRCLSVWVVIWAHNKRTPNKARICCVVVWLIALACSIPFVISRSVNNNRCGRNGDALKIKQLTVFRLIVGFLIPFLIITCCYVAMGVRARRTKRKKKLRPYFVILAVILAFFICWLPFQITELIIAEQVYIYEVDPSRYNRAAFHMARKISTVAVNLAFLNSCMNPFLYIFMCEEFKQKLKRSVVLVLEHAFSEEHLVFLSSQFSVTSRQSIVSGQNQRKGTQGSLLAFSGTRPSIGD